MDPLDKVVPRRLYWARVPFPLVPRTPCSLGSYGAPGNAFWARCVACTSHRRQYWASRPFGAPLALVLPVLDVFYPLIGYTYAVYWLQLVGAPTERYDEFLGDFEHIDKDSPFLRGPGEAGCVWLYICII